MVSCAFIKIEVFNHGAVMQQKITKPKTLSKPTQIIEEYQPGLKGEFNMDSDSTNISLQDELKTLQQQLADARNTIASLTKHAAAETVSKASEQFSATKDKVVDAASSYAKTAADGANTALSSANSLTNEVVDMTRRNPVGALSIALFAGLLIGLSSRSKN